MIEINGKSYKINLDISFGIMEDSHKHPDDPEVMKRMLKEVLIPSPTVKEIRAMRMSQIMDIIQKFTELQKKENIYFKKKRSR